MSDGKSRVAILMGSDSDWEVMSAAEERLRSFGVSCDVRVMSAHRTPHVVSQYVLEAAEQGTEVFIAAAGAAAHLAGVVAAHTTRPVIGVPLAATRLNGFDALLSTVQMPSGVPVATVAVGGADNAAILATQILGVSDSALAERLAAFKREMAEQVAAKNDRLREKMGA